MRSRMANTNRFGYELETVCFACKRRQGDKGSAIFGLVIFVAFWGIIGVVAIIKSCV